MTRIGKNLHNLLSDAIKIAVLSDVVNNVFIQLGENPEWR